MGRSFPCGLFFSRGVNAACGVQAIRGVKAIAQYDFCTRRLSFTAAYQP